MVIGSKLLPLLALSAWAGLPAAELVVRDVRAGFEYRTSDFDFEVDNGTTVSSGSDSFDDAYGITAGGMYSFAGPGWRGGWLVGAEANIAYYSYLSDGQLLSMSARLAGGYGYAFSDDWIAEFKPFVGIGIATFDFPATSGVAAFSADGTTLEFGAHGGVYRRISDDWLIGLELGYLASSFDLEGGGQNLTLDSDGIGAWLSLTWRLSDAPTALE